MTSGCLKFRGAFAGFDFHRMATFDASDVERLVQDARIVRHRGKIEAVIHNARQAVALTAQEGSLASFIWRFEPGPQVKPSRQPPQPRRPPSPIPKALNPRR